MHERLSERQQKVVSFLYSTASSDKARWPTISEVAERFNTSRSSAQYWLKGLVSLGWVKKEDGVGTPYVLTEGGFKRARGIQLLEEKRLKNES